jgi:hypothetical protein
MRAESHWHLRELLESYRVALPRDTELEEEALVVEWQVAQNGRVVQMVAKNDLKKLLGRSPDRLDACVMGLAHSTGGLGWGEYTAT